MEKIDIIQRAYNLTDKHWNENPGCFFEDADEYNFFADMVFFQLNEIKKQKDLQLFHYVVGPKFYATEIGVACAKRVLAHDKVHDSELTYRYISMVAKHFGIGNGKEFFDVAKSYQEMVDRYHFCIE